MVYLWRCLNPRRDPLEEIDWFGRHGFDFVDFKLEGGPIP
jgi:hypothetical protein